MKKLFKVSVVIIVLAGIVFVACNKQQSIEEPNKIVQIKVNPTIGKEHNQKLNEFLEAFHKDKNDNMTNQEKIDYVKEYIYKNYDVDISPVINTEISNLTNVDINSCPIYENLDLDGFVDDASSKFSIYFREQLVKILDQMRNANNDTTVMKLVLKDYLSQISEDNNFAPNEKEYFINMLYVYDSSISYWYNFNKESKAPVPDDMWKIPASDWTAGIIGLLGGPGVAVIGYLSGSALASIGLW